MFEDWPFETSPSNRPAVPEDHPEHGWGDSPSLAGYFVAEAVKATEQTVDIRVGVVTLGSEALISMSREMNL